ncbi:MAG: two-component system sensor histidine kinase NtrB, partial [Pyrinomonadaceae bacterium]
LLVSGESKALEKRRCCEMFWQTAGEHACVVDRALQTSRRVEVEIQAGPDETRPLLLIVQPLSRQGAFVIARDISDLRRAEADAIAQRSFMASVADLTPDEIYALDHNGRISWMNQRAEADDLLMLPGRLFIEFIADDCRDTVLENLRRSLAGEETQAEVRAVRTDASIRDVEVHTSPLWRSGEVAGALAFVRDVTERKRAQEMLVQSDKLRAVGELAAGVAHNLNNSLTVIQGRAQLLLMRASDESATKSLKVIIKAVEEGSRTLRRILDFARRDSTREFVPVELNELITSSVEIARPKWQGKTAENEITVQIEGHKPVYVLGELAELREVVLNLIFNAVDAMPDGGTMEMGAREEIDGGCFWVADTGSGMSAETVAHIFEPFFTTKGNRGTGLGLSASHGIIMRHKGEIAVVSEPGEGTRFEVRLPICDKRSKRFKNAQAADERQNLRDEISIPG